jgi:hypothetical protein
LCMVDVNFITSIENYYEEATMSGTQKWAIQKFVHILWFYFFNFAPPQYKYFG